MKGLGVLWFFSLVVGFSTAASPWNLGDLCNFILERRWASRGVLAHDIVATGARGFNSKLHADLKALVQEHINAHDLRTQGLKEGEQVYWLQQGRLKEFNEKIWDIGGTEYYLMTLDRNLHQLLEAKPELGRIVHRNYKDRVIVSSVSADDFTKRVLEPLRSMTIQEIQQVRGGGSSRDVRALTHAWHFATGSNLLEAYKNLKLKNLKLNYEDWRNALLEGRAKLEKMLAEKGIPFDSAIKTARVFKDQPKALLEWLNKRSAGTELTILLKRYQQLISVGDFLPIADDAAVAANIEELKKALLLMERDPKKSSEVISSLKDRMPLSWGLSRDIFLTEAVNAKHIIATDIQGLGQRATVAQDEWVKNGARTEDLPMVYREPTKFLEEKLRLIERGLRSILGKDARISLYSTGDDALWALPDMSEEQLRLVRGMLRQVGDLYYKDETLATSGDPRSLASAIHSARAYLKNHIEMP